MPANWRWQTEAPALQNHLSNQIDEKTRKCRERLSIAEKKDPRHGSKEDFSFFKNVIANYKKLSIHLGVAE